MLFTSLLKFHLCMTFEIGPFDPIHEPLILAPQSFSTETCFHLLLDYSVIESSCSPPSSRHCCFLFLMSTGHKHTPKLLTDGVTKTGKIPQLGAVYFNVQIVKSCSYID